MRSLAQGRTGAAVVERYARWIQVVRNHRTPLLASYPGLFVATPLVVTLALVGATSSPTLGALAVVLAIVARLGVAVAARSHGSRAVGLEPVALARLVVEVVLADLLLAVAFARAVTRTHVRWRGRTMEQHDDGWREAQPQPR